MTRIAELFERKNKRVLSIYYTAGYPGLESTMPVMESIQEQGVDMVELGMPYSDPLADGPVIQASSTVALGNGMTISKLFSQLQDFRKRIEIPVILMGYMNPVLQYGFENFCRKAKEVGIDGLILPDLPMHEYETEYGKIIRQFGLDFIFLVTPETSQDRVRKLDSLSSGFLYAVSSSSTTGKDKKMADQSSYFKNLGEMKLKNPIMVGFGVKDRETFETSCQYANGAIIGTAFIKAFDYSNYISDAVEKFIKTIL
ncbi:MAG TPA: tryptophan synthase subunit alpha [Puia sp.]|nr:tryptophan synthase subunit alpha [Puia sp.]